MDSLAIQMMRKLDVRKSCAQQMLIVQEMEFAKISNVLLLWKVKNVAESKKNNHYHFEMSILASCVSDSECSSNEVCVNGKCNNPCDERNSCGINALCQVANHQKLCICPESFTGNPEVECVRIPNTCLVSIFCN